MLAKEAFTAEGLYIDRHAITGFDGMYLVAYLLHDTDHFMSDRDSGHCTRHTSMLNVQITGAYTAESNTYNGIPCMLQFRFRFIDQFEMSLR